MTVFSAQRFEAFCSKLRINSKDTGRVPFKWNGAQRYVVHEIEKGLNDGIHTFVILKARQQGISTLCLALDIYWTAKNKGLQGGIVTDTDENRELFRSYVDEYKDPLVRQKIIPAQERHNRTQLVLANDSRLVYMVAGTKQKGDLGRAKGLNFLHATECGSWGDSEGYSSLMNTLSDVNPNRLYVFESTARGYNDFYSQCQIAKDSPTQLFIFVGWWRKESYRVERGSPEFRTYWDGSLTTDEKVWVREVYEQYGVSLVPEQIAWWRYYVAEKMKGDELGAFAEMPPTEEYAFQLSGSRFFSAERTNIAFRRSLQQDRLYYRYKFGINFEDTEFLESNEENAEVTIFETPTEDRRGVYALGCDPAFGSSEWADEFAMSMLRCYADRAVQVLEVGTTEWTEQQFAWAMAHLAGWYGNCLLCLEMQGPGGTVLNELNHLKEKVAYLPQGDPRYGAFDVVSRIRDYWWVKSDSMTRMPTALQWQSNPKEKVRMMTTLRSLFERDGMLVINSAPCMQQFRNIHRQGDRIGGEGRAKDDRVIALAIAVTAGWSDTLMREMQAAGRTFAKEHETPEVRRIISPLESNVLGYLKSVGVTLVKPPANKL